MESELTRLEEKRINAIDIHICLIAFLRAHQLDSWVKGFDSILRALESKNYPSAITLNKAIPRAGMGSFNDISIETQPGEVNHEAQHSFLHLKSAQDNSINYIRVYQSYEIDRPLIEVNLDQLDPKTRMLLRQNS